jgi:predicted Zn-dependent peptidase
MPLPLLTSRTTTTFLPANNLETALWLESDRMLSLAFDEESLRTQKNVVMEEFKEHYINQPYGDVWHKMTGLAYKVHALQVARDWVNTWSTLSK